MALDECLPVRLHHRTGLATLGREFYEALLGYNDLQAGRAVAITDHRLMAAKEGLAVGRYQALSVDVFDTLLWRCVPEPADVFMVLGRQLAAAGRLAAHVAPAAFADLRRLAERAAREKVQAVTGYREVTLADIYAALPEGVFAPGFAAADRAAEELACERALMRLDPDLVALMQAAKAAGRKVILVSDTYFKSEEVRGFLAAAGLGDPAVIDRLYVSCEMGRPKYRDLFDTILKDLGTAPETLIHIGDSVEADVQPCLTRKIASVHYDKWSFSPRVQTTEFPNERPRRTALLGGSGDFGLTGLRSRLRHRVPADLAPALRPYWSYGASTLAPVFTAFARWIVGTCQAKVAKQIYGIMREGRFLGRVVEATAGRLGVALPTQEIWLSRRAVLRAALYPDDLGVLSDAIMLTPGRNSDEILSGIGIARQDLAGAVPDGFDLAQPNALAVLCQTIAAKPALREKVLAVSARHRTNLLKGLSKRIDLASLETVTLMDLGYAATIQTVLARILAREGAKLKLAGLYLALNDRAVVHAGHGAELHAFLDAEGFNGTTAALLSRTPDVLEHACMCREGSLDAYDDNGAPVLLPNQRKGEQLLQMEALQAGVLAGVDAMNAMLGGFDRVPHDSPTLKDQVGQIITAALLYPTTEEAETIGAWHHEANFDLGDFRRLSDLAFDPSELEYRGLPALQDTGRHQVYWPAAAFTAANPFLAAAFSTGITGGYDPELFTSGPLLGGLTITPDLGAGFDTRRGGTVALGVNAFGRAHLQITLKPFGADVYRRLKLAWPAARSVIRLDQATVTHVGESERRTAAATVQSWSETREISPGTQLTDAKAAETVLDLGEPPPWAHALELTLRFKYLRLDPMFGAP